MRYITAIWNEIVTWCHGGMEPIDYGLLYNWYAATDARNIAADGWHVPTHNDFKTLILYIDPTATDAIYGGYHFIESLIAGAELKETGETYWIDPNTGATNSMLFNGRGAGYRDAGDGDFYVIKESYFIWLNESEEDPYVYMGSPGYHANTEAYAGSDLKGVGYSIRLLKDSTTLSDGEAGIYTGNDGKVYRTICIGTQEWVAHNLVETKYRNGDPIPEVTDDAAWAALITGALCAYDNNWNNV